MIAGNEFGDSDPSVAGNGGIMVEVPSTPVLTNDFANTNLQQITLNWVVDDEGGAPILGHKLLYKRAEDSIFAVLEPSL